MARFNLPQVAGAGENEHSMINGQAIIAVYSLNGVLKAEVCDATAAK
jgi:hypothetical protein